MFNEFVCKFNENNAPEIIICETADFNRCFIFNTSMANIKHEAHALMDDSDVVDDSVCFCCGITIWIMFDGQQGNEKFNKCSACKLATYCSRRCQVYAWKNGGHGQLCGQSEMLKRLCGLPVVGGVELSKDQRRFTFLLNHASSLPAYVSNPDNSTLTEEINRKRSKSVMYMMMARAPMDEGLDPRGQEFDEYKGKITTMAEFVNDIGVKLYRGAACEGCGDDGRPLKRDEGGCERMLCDKCKMNSMMMRIFSENGLNVRMS